MINQLVVYPSRTALWGGFLGSVLFAVAAFAILMLFGEDSPLFVTIIFWGILFLFGFLSVTTGFRLARNLSDPRPQLVLDASGITFFFDDGLPYPLAWKQVLGFEDMIIARQSFIRLDVENPAALIYAEPRKKHRRIMTHNMNLYGSPFLIAPTSELSPRELLSALGEFHEKYRPHGSA